ncbi:MAG: AbrB/MazE/SpoVT family DNA-binding domain-containing protein [archaeon]|nr:AbrB/MazE/SpoVT family DNA-binding domain-containing protein [archaeon]MCP8316988.1 AbrB/MazE/SpoVT family DNA-binding domain-containing protein [archaeon]MCP8321476.1 AbrB/MazE/SpoVT family DNA-binding domain-containing protein [archaeon]
MLKPQLRKIQLTGGTTYTVSLPKEWAEQARIKPQQQVALIPQADLSILLIPKGEIDKSIKEASIEYQSAVERDVIVRDFISHYLAGYDIIRVKFKGPIIEFKAFFKDLLRKKIVGVEIVGESSEEIIAQCLLAYSEPSLKKVVNRMEIIVSSMHKDAIISLKNQNCALAKDVIERDDEVDRFYHFSVRQLKMAVVDRTMIESMGLKSAVECLGYRIIAKSVERIGDHATKIAKSVLNLNEIPNANSLDQISRISDLVTEVYDGSLKALNKMDAKIAHESIIKASYVVKAEEESTQQLLESKQSTRTIVELKLILESLKRIADYSADISEITLNMIVATEAREHEQSLIS